MSATHAAQDLGIETLESGDGHCKCELTVAQRHLNRQGAGHGGILFTLADSAMAIAANSGSAIAVASQASINYLAAAKLGDRLVATASHGGGLGKSRIFDVTVVNQDGELLALFRGTTITIGQK